MSYKKSYQAEGHRYSGDENVSVSTGVLTRHHVAATGRCDRIIAVSGNGCLR